MFCTFLITSCTQEEDIKPVENTEIEYSNEELINVNRYWIKDEAFKIKQFCDRHDWPIIITESGLCYYIYHKGDGDDVKVDDVVTIDFEVRLLDSDTTLCYSSQELGPAQFRVEMDYVEAGLHEAVTYLKVRDKAYVILPHYLAHGLIGNTDKIPPLSPVLYNIHLLDVQKK